MFNNKYLWYASIVILSFTAIFLLKFIRDGIICTMALGPDSVGNCSVNILGNKMLVSSSGIDCGFGMDDECIDGKHVIGYNKVQGEWIRIDNQPISFTQYLSHTPSISTSSNLPKINSSDIKIDPSNKNTDNKNIYKIYSHSGYNISFGYPADFAVESHSGVASWDDTGKVDLDDYLSFSGSRGSFSIILPDHTAPFGTAPIHTSKDETITLGNRKVLKHIEFGSQDNPGPNQQGIWVLKYAVDIDGKKYRFQTSQEGIFGKYSISEEIDQIIQDTIKSIK